MSEEFNHPLEITVTRPGGRFAVSQLAALGRTGASMQIDYLADHQDFIPTLAQWHHRECAYLRPDDSVEARITRLRGCCGHCEIPAKGVSR